jgi:hypothetical protein
MGREFDMALTDKEIEEIFDEMDKEDCYWEGDHNQMIKFCRKIESAVERKLKVNRAKRDDGCQGPW